MRNYDGEGSFPIVFLTVPIVFALIIGAFLASDAGRELLAGIIVYGIVAMIAIVCIGGLIGGFFISRGVRWSVGVALGMAVLLSPFLGSSGFKSAIFLLLIFTAIYGFVMMLGALHGNIQERSHDDPFDYVPDPPEPSQPPNEIHVSDEAVNRGMDELRGK